MKLQNENLCIICLEEIQLYPITKLNCNHYFHYKCINLWKAKKNICPICRTQIIPKEKKPKSKSCITPLELILIICFIILFFSFFIFMVLKSFEKLKKKKQENIIYKTNNKKYKFHSFFFDLILAKQNEQIKILKNYATNFPNMIKNEIENFFDDIVEVYDEFIYYIHTFNQLRKFWKER